MQSVASAKPVNNLIVEPRARRKDVIGFGFEHNAVDHDVIDDQVGIDSLSWIKLVVQKHDANLIGRDSTTGSVVVRSK